MAVLETWLYRVPMLMTEKCNLPEGFTESAALPKNPDAESIANSLIQLFSLNKAERPAMGERGRALVQRRFA